MIGKIGVQELILILALALIIFGPRKLPELGRSIGNGIREFRRAATDVKKSVSIEADIDKEEEVQETKANVEKTAPNEETVKATGD